MPTPHEPTVPLTTPPPPNYRLVPRGNPYITLNCRKATHASHQKVYNVVDKNKHPVGIRVPQQIYTSVLASFHATKTARASAVQKRDGKLEEAYRDAVIAAFPKIPREKVPRIVGHAMEKRSGRVGRTGKLGVRDKAVLGVLAHIRHVHSDYEALLKGGVDRAQARRLASRSVREKAREWGFTGQGRGGSDGEKKKQRQAVVQKGDKRARVEGEVVSKSHKDSSASSSSRAGLSKSARRRAARRRRKAGRAAGATTTTLPLRGKSTTQPASPGPSASRGVRVTTRSMARTSRQDVSQRSIPDHISISSDDEGSGLEDSVAGGSSQDEFFWISSDDELDGKNDSYDEDDYDDDD